MSIHEIVVPDIGDSRDVEVSELLVGAGATVAVGDALLVLESDKASVEVTATFAGVVREFAVSAGDKVVEAQVLARIESDTAAAPAHTSAVTAPAAQALATSTIVPVPAATTAPAPAAPPPSLAVPAAAALPAALAPTMSEVEVVVPDLGDAKNVVISEILVAVGATVKQGQALVVLESDKASMEIEATADGVVQRIGVVAGAEVAEGTVIAVLKPARQGAVVGPATASTPAAQPTVEVTAAATSVVAAAPAVAPASAPPAAAPAQAAATSPFITAAGAAAAKSVYAGPGVRKVARELGVDLSAVTATGPRGRTLKDDVHRYVKQRMQAPVVTAAASAAANQITGIPPIPVIDFAKFGPIEEQKLPRVQRVGGVNLHRSWLNVPHVTHNDEADLTDLEAFRKSLKDEAQRVGVRVTPLAFLLKACANALMAFPKFNSSLSPNKDALIYKRYYNIGMAVDTPDGLVVPVIKGVDQKGVYTLAKEVIDLSERARIGKLKPDEMSGGTFSITSLGVLGGTSFTPIINAPEVAILGVAKLATKPIWDGSAFVPRDMLPLSLSYDHRVVNGADAARFVTHLMAVLADMRRVLL